MESASPAGPPGSNPTTRNASSVNPAVKKASRDVYLYFDHNAKVRAPFDARNLIVRVQRILQG
jgi:hypothetical protein